MTCHLIEVTNETETEVSLFLRNHVAEKSKTKVELPQVVTHAGCLYNEAHFSRDLGMFVLDCRGPDVPRVLLFNATSLNEELTLDNNTLLRERVANMSLPKVRMFRVATRSGYYASVRMYLPPEITFDDFKEYPFIVHV